MGEEKIYKESRDYELIRVVTKEEKDHSICFDLDEEAKQWVFRVTAQTRYTEEGLQRILDKLKELNSKK